MATKNFNKKIISAFLLFLVLTFSFSPIFAKKAEAQWIVFDSANFGVNLLTSINTTMSGPIKDFGLDSIAWIVANMVIERIAASTVSWINSGFQGSPAFVTDPGSYFKNIGDQTAGQLIFNHPDLRFMCAPLRARVQIALTQSYVQPFGNFQCTLSGVVDNFDNFMNDFYEGGWDGFIQVTQRSQNNPLGLYNQAQNQINVSIGSALGQKQQELNWGNGFLSWRGPCQKLAPGESATGLTQDQADALPCINEGAVKTPGSVIEGQLNNVLNTGNNRLQVADEINEIIAALLNQLVSKAIGAVGNGLRSLASPGSGSSSGSYTSELQRASARDVVPMPAGGQCPTGYIALSANECASNSDTRELIGGVNQAQSNLQGAVGAAEGEGAAVEAQSGQVLGQILPPDTSGFPIP